MSRHKPYYDHDAVWATRAERNSPLWGAYSPVVYEQVVRMAQNFCPPPARWLDVGCGAGALGLRCQDAGYSYTGIDDSAVAIDLGRRSFPGLELKRSDFAQPLTTSDEPFDIISAINSLHCLVEDEHRLQFLTNLHRSTKENGLLILTTMCGPVGQGFRASKAPRAYRLSGEILDELHATGWLNILLAEIEDPKDTGKIPNLTVVASNKP